METVAKRTNEDHQNKELHFKHLPSFAGFLLSERLDELIKESLDLARKIEYPLLKYFIHMPEEQLLELSRLSQTEFLTHAINNTLAAQIEHSLRLWRENQLPLIDKDQVIGDDITMGSYLRKQAWIRFLPDYTTDPAIMLNILSELDEYHMNNDAAAFTTFVNIQKGKLEIINAALEQKEESLRQANHSLDSKNTELERSNKELTSFNYVASHDLQEPLRKIKTYSDLILQTEGGNLSEKGRKYFSNINSSAHRMNQLIQDLLAYSRTHNYTSEIRPVDLNATLAEISALYEEQLADKKLVFDISEMPVVKGISFQLYQLFENIINNSVKYGREDTTPTVKIYAETVSGGRLDLADADPARDYHHITILDNGIGFEPEFNSKIFEIFQRLHNPDEYSGTGIGLAICKRIVQNHDGFILATGVPGTGSTFSIYLPA